MTAGRARGASGRASALLYTVSWNAVAEAFGALAPTRRKKAAVIDEACKILRRLPTIQDRSERRLVRTARFPRSTRPEDSDFASSPNVTPEAVGSLNTTTWVQRRKATAAVPDAPFGGWDETFSRPHLCAATADRLTYTYTYTYTFTGTLPQSGTGSHRAPSHRSRTARRPVSLKLRTACQNNETRGGRADGSR